VVLSLFLEEKGSVNLICRSAAIRFVLCCELFLLLPVNLGCYIYGDAPQSIRQVLIVFGTARPVFTLNVLQKF